MRECRKARRRSPAPGGGEGRGEERAGLHLVPGASPSEEEQNQSEGTPCWIDEHYGKLAGACKTWHDCTTAGSRPVLHHAEQGGQESGRKLARACLQVRELSSLKREKSRIPLFRGYPPPGTWLASKGASSFGLCFRVAALLFIFPALSSFPRSGHACAAYAVRHRARHCQPERRRRDAD